MASVLEVVAKEAKQEKCKITLSIDCIVLDDAKALCEMFGIKVEDYIAEIVNKSEIQKEYKKRFGKKNINQNDEE